MGYGFVTGLAYQYIKKKAEDLNVFDVPPPPPPPPDVPPPPPPPNAPPPPPSTQIFQPPQVFPVPSVNTITTTNVPQPPPPTSPPAPPQPPAPPPPAPRPVALTPRGSPQSWVTNDDYPPSALRANQEGTTRYRLTIDSGGRVTDCQVTASSGVSTLDSAVCSLLRRRARFNPGKDSAGNATGGFFAGSFRWVVPKD
ncbi:MAG: TonB family protein [Sphingomonas sp.]